MRRMVAALVLAAVMPASGCVSTDEVGGSNNPTPTTAPIAAEAGTIGADIPADGLLVTVQDITAFEQSPNNIPRIRVVMRAENTSSSVQDNPDVQLVCDETTNTGDWFTGSTWEPTSGLPVNAVNQGEVLIGFPLRGDSPEYPVVTCTGARLRVTITSTTGDGSKIVEVPVDPAVIEESIRRPRGPNLPLPRSDESAS